MYCIIILNDAALQASPVDVRNGDLIDPTLFGRRSKGGLWLVQKHPLKALERQTNILQKRQKDHTQYHGFDQVPFRTHNFSLEGATELKCTPFCSSLNALSDGMLSCQNQTFKFLAENHGL